MIGPVQTGSGNDREILTIPLGCLEIRRLQKLKDGESLDLYYTLGVAKILVDSGQIVYSFSLQSRSDLTGVHEHPEVSQNIVLTSGKRKMPTPGMTPSVFKGQNFHPNNFISSSVRNT